MIRHASTAFIIAGVTGVILTSSAWAGARVETVKPQVSINSGQGWKVVTASTGVSNGDQVMAAPAGRGKIIYPGGCVVNVDPGSVVTVKEGSCKMAQPMTVGPACDPSTDPKCLVPAAAGIPWWVVPVGVGIGVAAACVGFCQPEEHHRSP